MVKTLASAFHIGDRRIRFKHITVKEMHTEYNVFARLDFGELSSGKEKWIPKLIGVEFAFLDEVFRNQRIMATLNEVLEERVFEGMPLKWIFFASATNPPNQYYRNVDILNMADLDRFNTIIEVEDNGLGFADKVVEGFKPELDLVVDVSDIRKIRDEISSTKVKPEASELAKILITAFSVCGFEPVTGSKNRYIIYNKFAVINDLKCYKCIFQKHRICPRYALAPKRALRSLIGLAKARAWIKDSKVSVEDILWAFKYTIPGRTAIISNELREEVPTYSLLYDRMLEDFREWYAENYSVLESGVENHNDPLVHAVRRFLKPVKRIVGYKVYIEKDKLPRFLKWLTINRGLSIERAASMLQELQRGVFVQVDELVITPMIDAIEISKFENKEEVEKLCVFLEK
ncbi:MAG: hypothetical protein J7K23_07965 [Thermoproteales archaeon]|nr:hypothetical protein [Thermoproteales archaeon]